MTTMKPSTMTDKPIGPGMVTRQVDTAERVPEMRPMTKDPVCDSCKRGPQQLLIPVVWKGDNQKWCARCAVGGVMV